MDVEKKEFSSLVLFLEKSLCILDEILIKLSKKEDEELYREVNK